MQLDFLKLLLDFSFIKIKILTRINILFCYRLFLHFNLYIITFFIILKLNLGNVD